MDILEEIVAQTRQDLARRKKNMALDDMRRSAECVNRHVLRMPTVNNGTRPYIIAEFKRKSPSREDIALSADPESIARCYQDNGASAISVLTEPHYFQGSLRDLEIVRRSVTLPVLQKDFIVDPYQIYEAKIWGADLVLLIAKTLTKSEIATLAAVAHSLDLAVLCEVFALEEVERATGVDFLGVNCRNLATFKTDLQRMIDLAQYLPEDVPWVAESGIQSRDDLHRLWDVGYRYFLIGEYLMASPVYRLRELGRDWDYTQN